jgi:hypothetical protein
VLAPARGGLTPLVECVRFLLHVPRAVSEPDELEAVSFVEAASPLVLLEHPKFKALGLEALCVIKQCRADATVLNPSLGACAWVRPSPICPTY